jgi:hypothetical protein
VREARPVSSVFFHPRNLRIQKRHMAPFVAARKILRPQTVGRPS